MERIVTSFTDPGGHVILLPWPIPILITPGTLDRKLQDALTAVRGLDRTAQLTRIKPEPGPHHPAVKLYWDDLVSGPRHVGDTDSAPRTREWLTPALDRCGGSAAGADLIITSLRPKNRRDRASGPVALTAARLLLTGGVLAVLTHSDTSQGQLVDPTGAVVTAAQNADLLYLQHIVVVHAPVRGDEFMIDNPHLRPRAQPTTHHRIHTDLLVFAQPHDHHHQARPLP